LSLEHDASEGFSSLAPYVIATLAFRSEILPDAADLARLRAVSPLMRDAVNATDRELKEPTHDKETREARILNHAEAQALARSSVA
jgi:hypothetical protein